VFQAAIRILTAMDPGAVSNLVRHNRLCFSRNAFRPIDSEKRISVLGDSSSASKLRPFCLCFLCIEYWHSPDWFHGCLLVNFLRSRFSWRFGFSFLKFWLVSFFCYFDLKLPSFQWLACLLLFKSFYNTALSHFVICSL